MSETHNLSRRRFLFLGGLAIAGATVPACAASSPATSPAPEAPVTSAEQALSRLLEGNRRYAASKSTDLHESESRRLEVAKEQSPFATIFGCVDSRVPPELLFDRGLGDLFVIRTAGQVIDEAVLGSLEFGVEELHIPLLMVLGHERCGAVKAAIEAVEKGEEAPDEIDFLVKGIKPAVDAAKGQSGDLLDSAVRVNVKLVVDKLKRSPILADAIGSGRLSIVGARYDLDSGLVEVTV